MYYKYDCYLNGVYYTNGVIYADTIEEAYKLAKLKYDNKYEITNVKLIKNHNND